MKTILFICTANMFRSPIAAGLFSRELSKRDLVNDFTIISAGTWTTSGVTAPPITKAVAKSMGIPRIEDHRSAQVTENDLSGSDLIIVMEANHKEALCSEFPTYCDKIHLLSTIMTHTDYDIPDPSKSGNDAHEVAKELEKLITTGFDEILSLIK
jgi:protein-tyrosine phosphatase